MSSERAEGERPVVMVRRPSSRLAEGELTHLDRVPVDVELARRQWGDYVAALADNGFPAVEVDAADDHPDSVFVEDAVVVFGDLAVLTSPGAASRRGETDAVRPVVERLGLDVAAIELPGTLDGPRGYDVVAVPVTRALHLKSAVTALPDGTVVGHPDLVDHPEVFDTCLSVRVR